MNTQRGFTLVEGLLIAIVVGIVGFAGYTVWSNQQDDETVQTEAVKQEQQPEQLDDKDKPESVAQEPNAIPEGWKTVSNNGLTVSYPETWDNTDEDYQKLNVLGLLDGDIANTGFGSPFGYMHKGNDSWQRVSSDGTPAEGSEPTIAEVNVAGAVSTIVVGGGDGGCGSSRIIFATETALYAVALPWECDAAVTSSAGIDSKIVTKDLNKVIQLIEIN